MACDCVIVTAYTSALLSCNIAALLPSTSPVTEHAVLTDVGRVQFRDTGCAVTVDTETDDVCVSVEVCEEPESDEVQLNVIGEELDGARVDDRDHFHFPRKRRDLELRVRTFVNGFCWSPVVSRYVLLPKGSPEDINL